CPINTFTPTNTPTITPTNTPLPTCGPSSNYLVTTSTGAPLGTTTNLVAGSQGDDNVVAIPLPFTFYLYGQAFNSVNASTNGNLQFNSSNNQYLNSCPIPRSDFTDAIMPYWDDQRT